LILSTIVAEAAFAILLYVGLLAAFHIYRSRQAAMLARLVDAGAMEARDRLASSLAHDFNNILSVIGGTSQLMLRDKLSPFSRPRMPIQSSRPRSRPRNLSPDAAEHQDIARGSRQPAAPLVDFGDVVSRQMYMIGRNARAEREGGAGVLGRASARSRGRWADSAKC